MRILFMLFIAIAITAQYGCNDSSTNTGSSDNNTSGQVETATNLNETAAAQNNGPMQLISDRSDAAIKGKVVKSEVVLSDDENPIPHTVVTFEVLETLFGELEDYYSNNTINIKYVEGCYPDGRCVAASHNPAPFAEGQEAFVFLHQQTDSPCGFTECENGVFLIGADGQISAPNKSTVVFDDQGKAKFVKSAQRENAAYKSLLAKNHVNTFSKSIASLGKNTSADVKSRRVKIKTVDKTSFKGSISLTQSVQGPYDNATNEKHKAASKAAQQRQYAALSKREQCEFDAYMANNRNPVVTETCNNEE